MSARLWHGQPASSAYLTSSRAREGRRVSPVIRRRFLRSEDVFAATLRVAQSDLKDVLSFYEVDVLSFYDVDVLSFLGPSCLCCQFSPPAS